MAGLTLGLPTFTADDLTDAGMRQRVASYIYQLAEQVKYLADNVDMDNVTDKFLQDLEYKIVSESGLEARVTKAGESVITSGVRIESGCVLIDTPLFSVSITDGAAYLQIDKNGVSASSVVAPNVRAQYAGATEISVGPTGDFRSILDAVSHLNGKHLPEAVTVTLAAGASDVMPGLLARVHGLTGAKLTVTGGASSSVGGRFVFADCGNVIEIAGLTIDAGSAGGAPVSASNCALVTVSDCTIYGAATCEGVRTVSSRARVADCGFSSSGVCVGAHDASYVFAHNLSASGAHLSDGSLVQISGTQPTGTNTAENGGAYIGVAAGTSGGVTEGGTDYQTVELDLYSTYSYAYTADQKWTNVNSTFLMQGYTRFYPYAGQIYFENTPATRALLASRTIVSASISFKRKARCVNNEVPIHLYGGGYPSSGNSVSSSMIYDFGVIGSAPYNDPGNTYSIAVQGINAFLADDFDYFWLYSAETEAMNGVDFSRNAAEFEDLSALTIVYA